MQGQGSADERQSKPRWVDIEHTRPPTERPRDTQGMGKTYLADRPRRPARARSEIAGSDRAVVCGPPLSACARSWAAAAAAAAAAAVQIRAEKNDGRRPTPDTRRPPRRDEGASAIAKTPSPGVAASHPRDAARRGGWVRRVRVNGVSARPREFAAAELRSGGQWVLRVCGGNSRPSSMEANAASPARRRASLVSKDPSTLVTRVSAESS